MSVIDPARLAANRIEAILNYHERTGQTRAEVDVSGGIDSAVVLALVVRAIGADNVTAVFQGINSSQSAHDRAKEMCESVGVRFVDFDGSYLFNEFMTSMTDALVKAGFDAEEIRTRLETDPTVRGSIRSTLRAPWGRGANRLTGGGIRHGTGNEDEDRWMRFYQKGGDGEVDTNPIAMLSKGEVFQLARALGVPASILNARPSPDLWGVGEAHNDEDEIGNYLGIKNSPFPFYSYVGEDGQYLNLGLIERVSRFVDNDPHACNLFSWGGKIPKDVLESMVDGAVSGQYTPYFEDVPRDLVRTLLAGAARVEWQTRHKMNPNCPTLGTRLELVGAGILSE